MWSLESSSERYFSEPYNITKDAVRLWWEYRSCYSDVNSRIRECKTSSDISIDIAGIKRYFCMFDECCDDEIELTCIDSSCWSLWITKFCRCYEGFYFDKKRSGSFDSHRDDGSRVLMREIDKLHTSIHNIMKPIFLHAKESDFISWPKSIFQRSKNPIILPFFSFKKEYGIHQMLHHLRSRYWPIFGYMSNKEDALSGTFCELHIRFARELETWYDSKIAITRHEWYRIDDDELTLILHDQINGCFETRCLCEENIFICYVHSFCTRREMCEVLFSTYIECGSVILSKPISNLERESGFSNTRFAREKCETPLRESTSEHSWELLTLKNNSMIFCLIFTRFFGNWYDWCRFPTNIGWFFLSESYRINFLFKWIPFSTCEASPCPFCGLCVAIITNIHRVFPTLSKNWLYARISKILILVTSTPIILSENISFSCSTECILYQYISKNLLAWYMNDCESFWSTTFL